MAWSPSDFKFDPNQSFDSKSFTTDWNKNFTKYGDSENNKGMDFLKAFTKNAANFYGNKLTGQDQGIGSTGSSGGFGTGNVGSDISFIHDPGTADQIKPGEPSPLGQIAGLALQTAGMFL